VDDYESPKALAEYIRKVAEDEDLYNSYFSFYKESLPTTVSEKIKSENRTRGEKDCDICTYLQTHGAANGSALPGIEDMNKVNEPLIKMTGG